MEESAGELMNRILLVEDDDLLAEGLIFALEKEAYHLDRASSVSEARVRLSGQMYDLLLLDVMLPDGTGFELCRQLRTGSDVPVIFLTACDDEVNVVLGLELGGDDYMTKPFRLRELISRIKAILRRAGGTSASSTSAAAGHGAEEGTLSSAGITLRLMETKAEKSGAELDLTPVEYRLLTLFLRHPGMTLTRSKLLDRLWDEQGEFVDDNTLSVHIRRLREKVEDDPSHPSRIRTVRGVGYRWEAGGRSPHE
jgi:two-component system, OmpR family, response regulator RegX3